MSQREFHPPPSEARYHAQNAPFVCLYRTSPASNNVQQNRGPVTDTAYQTDFVALSVRATESLSATPRPFLRWAGSKRALLPHIVPLLPRTFSTYYEPFLGGGSLFFLLSPRRAVLSDSIANLIETYSAVRDNVTALLRCLAPLDALDEDQYYEIRKATSDGRYAQAARFIYLNHSCWNGLYRVNSRGQFNVPYGRPATRLTYDAENLRACARLLANDACELQRADFRESVANAKANDFVFLDPPYVTGHNNNGFVDYNERLFRWRDQEELAALAIRLAARGVRVMVTNANHERLLELYRGFTAHVILRTTTLAANISKRGVVTEAVLTSY